MLRQRAAVLALVSAVACTGLVAIAGAQDFDLGALPPDPGEEATREELEAWRLAMAQRHIDAREKAEAIVKARPRSYVGHFVLGFVHHYGEGNFPRALYHYDLSLRLFELKHGARPSTSTPWRWHARLLRELAGTHGDLEHHSDKVRYLERHNELYEPDLLADRAWPLMKMGKHDEARRAAQEGISSGDPRQLEVALNALCAIEFEAGNDGASYEACKRALDWAREQGGSVNAVDLTNFAEASRSLFKLDEAERVLLEATEADVAWYGNPWLELGELYTREARYPEALNALRQVPRYRAQRPPHVRDADRNEGRRALAAFFLVVGKPANSLRITDQALVLPDRRAHNSRDPAQDLALVALLDRRARFVAAEMRMERGAGRAIHQRVWEWLNATRLRMQGWLAGRQAARLLSDDRRIVGIFRIGTSESAITPPWLAGELVDVLGPGVVREALRRGRSHDRREAAAGYYDAFEAEAALSAGDEERALELATRSLSELGRGEALLRARVHAIAAEAARQTDRTDTARAHYDEAFQIDPGIFRRLGFAVPVRISTSGDDVADEIADILERSPRFEIEDGGLTITIEATVRGGRACLLTSSGAMLGCGRAEPTRGDDASSLATKIAHSFQGNVFAPRVDLSQTDANSLDGSNRVSRDPLHTLFE